MKKNTGDLGEDGKGKHNFDKSELPQVIMDYLLSHSVPTQP